MLLCGRTLLVVRFPQVFFSQTSARKDFVHWGSPFWITPRDGPFLSRIWTSFQVRPEIFLRVPPKRSISFAQLSQNRLLWRWILRYTTLDPFFSQNRKSSLSTLFLRLLARFLLTISMSIQAIIAMDAPVSRLVITTHGRMPIITRRISTSCLHRQGILAPVAGLASGLFERLSSVRPFPVGTEEDPCPLPFRLRS